MAQETRQRRVYDTTLCPLPDNTAPNPQFVAGTAFCAQTQPRTSSQRMAYKRDENPASPTFGQWLNPAANGYVAAQQGGGFFAYDSDPVACPLPVAKSLLLYGNYRNCNFRFTAARSDAAATPLTVDFTISAVAANGSFVPFGSGSVTIPAGQLEATSAQQAPIEANVLYFIRNAVVSDPAYPVPVDRYINSTPSPTAC